MSTINRKSISTRWSAIWCLLVDCINLAFEIGSLKQLHQVYWVGGGSRSFIEHEAHCEAQYLYKTSIKSCINMITFKMFHAPLRMTKTLQSYLDALWWEQVPSYVGHLMTIHKYAYYLQVVWWKASATVCLMLVLANELTISFIRLQRYTTSHSIE